MPILGKIKFGYLCTCKKTQPDIFIICGEMFPLFKFVKTFKIKASSYELWAMQDV